MAVVIHEDTNKEESKLFSDMGIGSTDMGEPSSLRYRVLTLVLAERYDGAIQELKGFIEQPSEFPDFKERTYRFINHCIDLIYAIKAKRSFPGISSLTRAKQQELREKFKEHLRELQFSIKKIEKNQKDLRVSDARSTIYVVRTAWYSVVALVSLWFFLEISNGLAKTTFYVIDDTMTRGSDW
ncbi:MAG TPA: hypothetical protein VIG33_01535, partial [Pseudobdellovibrionaceae bacterium]